jgi:hypothetical protein
MVKTREAEHEGRPTTIAGTIMVTLAAVILLCQALVILQHVAMLYCPVNSSSESCQLFNFLNSQLMDMVLKAKSSLAK